MRIGVPKEIYAGEKRVATTPDVATQLMKLGFDVSVESGAGAASNFSDGAYSDVGCDIVDSVSELWSKSDIVLKVRAPEGGEASQLRSDQTLISFLWPAQNPELLKQLTETRRNRHGHGQRAAYFARTESGCLEFDGEHRGLPRRCRSSAAFWTLFHRPNHGCRQGPACQGAGHRRRCCRPGCHRRRQEHGRNRAVFRYAP